MVSKFVTYSGLTLYFGLSTDTMPKDVPNGSKYTTIDTDEEYWYDKENHGWYDADGKFIPDNDEKGDDDAMIVEFSVGESDILTCDKTIAELVEFIEADKQLIAKLVTPIGIVYYAQLVLYLPAITSPPSPTDIVFDLTIEDSGTVYLYTIEGNDLDGDSWEFTSKTIKELQ